MTGGTWRLAVSARLRGVKTPTGGTTSRVAPAGSAVQALSYGTGTGRFNIEVAQLRPLNAGASETLNLFDGTLLDVFGDAAPFRSLMSYAIWVYSDGDSSGVTVGNAGSNPHPLFWSVATNTQTVYPDNGAMTGGNPGVAVTTSACNLKVANNGAVAVTYALYLAGSSAAGGAAAGPLGLTYP